jgi:hypothetical protein
LLIQNLPLCPNLDSGPKNPDIHFCCITTCIFKDMLHLQWNILWGPKVGSTDLDFCTLVVCGVRTTPSSWWQVVTGTML